MSADVDERRKTVRDEEELEGEGKEEEAKGEKDDTESWGQS